MNVVGVLRVKNEEEFLERCLVSLWWPCSRVIVLDDHSTDRTAEIAQSFRCVDYYASPFTKTPNETRDRQWLLKKALELRPDWVVGLDGDEDLPVDTQRALHNIMTVICADSLPRNRAPAANCLLLNVVYFWNDLEHIRTDGIYNCFSVPRAFTTWGSDLERLAIDVGYAFHTSFIPNVGFKREDVKVNMPLNHYGYLRPEMRIKKYEFYNSVDPNNQDEDRYRHMVIGDILPADAVTRHAGPLRIEEYKR